MDKVNGHHLLFIRYVETRVTDRDTSSAIIKIPLYMCLNCGWEGYAPKVYPCLITGYKK